MMSLEQAVEHCVQQAVSQGALRRADGLRACLSESPPLLGSMQPLEGDYAFFRAHCPHESIEVFIDAFERKMTDLLEAQDVADFPFLLMTSKGSDRWVSLRAAAEWLAVYQPAYCAINGAPFEWVSVGDDTETDLGPEVEAIEATMKAALDESQGT